MSIDTIVILFLVVAAILGLVVLERHSRKNTARDKASGVESAPAKPGE
jgi:positive regulator of sigma E activity